MNNDFSKKILKVYEYNINQNFKMDFVDRNINETLVEKFKENLSEKTKHFVEKIIENTIYINFEEFNKKLENIIDSLDKNINYYLIYNNDKFGSENWIYHLLWKKIKNNILGFIILDDENLKNFHINENTNILIIDDAIYSGNNVLGTIDLVTYYNKNKKLNFFVYCTYISEIGYDNINDFCKKNKNINYKLFYTNILKPIYTDEEIDESIKKDLDIEIVNLAIYFDHKIANNFGSFPKIYKSIIKNKPSREKIEFSHKLHVFN